DLPRRLGRWLRLLTAPSADPAPPPAPLGATAPPASGWDAVQAARSPHRPRAESYLDSYFEWREDISGDRCGGVDSGVSCGFGRRDGVTIAYAAQCGTPTTPAGFRTAADRKSTRLNSSHVKISYAVFCLKKKKTPISAATA